MDTNVLLDVLTEEPVRRGGSLRESLFWDAGFLARKVFRAYRRRGGDGRSPLPDFYMGAHAAVCGYTLLTRDAGCYRMYYSRLAVVGVGGGVWLVATWHSSGMDPP